MFHQTWFALSCKEKSKLPVCLSLSLLKQRSPACLCVWVRVSMHQQLCSRSWREGSALGRARKIVHPDSPAALYKDKGKKALLPLYLDRLYWASCLRFSPPSSCTAAEISHQSHVGGWPSSPSQWGKSEPDNDLGDNNRAEERNERWG